MRKSSKLRKVIALLLVFTMLFSTQLMNVSAAEGDETQQEEVGFFQNILNKIISFFESIIDAIRGIFGGGNNNDDPDDPDDPYDPTTPDLPGQTSDFYVSLPITIRDYAADGMLFEWNEVGYAGDITKIEKKTDARIIANNNYGYYSEGGSVWSDDSKGVYINPSSKPSNNSWLIIICNDDHTIKKVFSPGNYVFASYTNFDKTGCFEVFAHSNALNGTDDQKAAYNRLSGINDSNKDHFTISYNTTSKKINVKEYNVVVDADVIANGMNVPDPDSMNIGMLNKYNSSSAITVSSTTHRKYIWYYDVSTKARYKNTINNFVNDPTNGDYWDVFACNSDGTIKAVYRSGTSLDASVVNSASYVIFASPYIDTKGSTETKKAYALLTQITNANKDRYRITCSQVLCNATDSPTSTPSAGSFVLTHYSAAINSSILENVERYGDTISCYRYGNTLGFGLLHTDNVSQYKLLPKDNGSETQPIKDTKYFNNGSFGSATVPPIYKAKLNSELYEDVYGALIRTDLIEPTLDSNKKIVYTQYTVDYVEQMLKHALEQPWDNGDNTYNMWYVMGTKLFDDDLNYVGPNIPSATKDLADVLRAEIQTDGTYEASKAKYESGQLTLRTINSYYDAAYYLLHNIFDDEASGGYGMTVSEYKTIRLVSKKDDGKEYYVFNSGYKDTEYDPYGEGTIYNVDTETIIPKQYGTNKSRGNTIPENRFDPIKDDMGYGRCGSVYENFYDKNGGHANDKYLYYENTNYNLSLEGHAKFIYYEENNQFFTFTGDDDVYLFINGIKVLDMGGAHSISKCSINLNEVAQACGLVDGMAYDFDFYYMERHGAAANFCIETNIMIVDPDMVTTKVGLQDGTSTGYGGFVDPTKPVEYGFGIENAGKDNIGYLTYDDTTLGDVEGVDDVHIGYNGIVLNSETKVEDLYVRYYRNATQTNFPTDSYYVAFDKDEFVDAFIEAMGEVEGDYSETKIKAAIDVAVNRAMQNNDQYNRFVTNFDKDAFIIGFYDCVYVRGDNEVAALDELKARTLAGVEKAFESIRVDFEKKIKKVLKDGIPVGAKITVYGIYHTITEEEWSNGETVVQTTGEKKFIFPNRVYTSAISTSDNTTTKVLHGTADWRVQKRITKNIDLHFYEWATKPVDITREELIEAYIDPENPEFDSIDDFEYAEVVLCSATGSTTSANINRRAEIRNDGSIRYINNNVGDDVFYYRLKINDVMTGVAKVNMYIYDVKNNAYILDYGLPVELNGPNFGLTRNDHLYVRTNPYGTHSYIDNIDVLKADYGDFVHTKTNDSVKYVMNKFLSDVEIANVYVVVVEDGADIRSLSDINKCNGVVMWEEVDVVPANVMYYEDTFDALTYICGEGDEWVLYTARDENGNSYVGQEQSPDQSYNFGYDPNYSEDDNGTKEGVWLRGEGEGNGDKILDGDASNGTIHELVVSKTGEVLRFEFKGTGFEIIARGLISEYGIFSVRVEPAMTDGNGDPLKDENNKIIYDEEHPSKEMPVIMQSTGENLYQVPVMSIKDLPLGNYRVIVSAMGSERVPRKVYIDGIRIFNPLDDDKAIIYYPPDEYNAEFYQIKDLINGDTTTTSFVAGSDYYTLADWEDGEAEWKYVVIDLGKELDKSVSVFSPTDIVSDIIINPCPSKFRDFWMDISYLACFANEADANAYANGKVDAYTKAGRTAPTEVLDDANIALNPSIRVDVEEGFNRIKTLNSYSYIAYETSGTHTFAEMRYCVIKYRTCGAANGKQSISLRTVGQAVFADLLTGRDVVTPATRGTTLIEDLDSIHTLVTTHNTSTYLNDGPNNEIYLEGDSGFSGIAFHLYPDENVPPEERTIQVEAHRKIEASYPRQAGYATLIYGSTSYSLLAQEHKIYVKSGTEQYFVIDPRNLEYDEENGRYTVYIAAGTSENNSNSLALSTLKVFGYTVKF